MQDGVMADVTNQVRAVGQNLVAGRRAGFGPDALLAIRRDSADEPLMGDVGVTTRIENDPFGKTAKARHLDRPQPIDGEQ